MKLLRKAAASALIALIYVCALSAASWALSIGTFNIEYFTVSGKGAYVDSDLKELARSIRISGADILALQEIGEGASLRYFLQRELKGWKYVIHENGSRQNLAFIWNDGKVRLLEGPTPFFRKDSFSWKGRNLRLFDRPPLAALFLDRESARRFRLINVHLKSQNPRGTAEELLYSETKRGLQLLKTSELALSLEGPRFVLGDFNTETVIGTDFPVLSLAKGHSYDRLKVNIDHIGYLGVTSDGSWHLEETESAITRRSTKRREHPDHDIIVLHFLWPPSKKTGEPQP